MRYGLDCEWEKMASAQKEEEAVISLLRHAALAPLMLGLAVLSTVLPLRLSAWAEAWLLWLEERW